MGQQMSFTLSLSLSSHLLHDGAPVLQTIFLPLVSLLFFFFFLNIRVHTLLRIEFGRFFFTHLTLRLLLYPFLALLCK